MECPLGERARLSERTGGRGATPRGRVDYAPSGSTVRDRPVAAGRLAAVEEAALGRFGDGLRAVVGTEFVHDGRDVKLDCTLRDPERPGDLLGRSPGRDFPEDGALTCAQGRGRAAGGADLAEDLRGDGRGEVRPAAVHGTDRARDLLDGCTLQHVAARAGPDGAEDAFVRVVGGEDDDAGPGHSGRKARDGLDTREPRQLEVEQNDV